ncbi:MULTISPECIES: helix-turn-helix domain-containing protein [Cyanophyceae]|uniref:helix-turn-helix domain-containing protein n=1 Tax=Cyanophyceae TaxID=3028117 RepID=UPI00325FB987
MTSASYSIPRKDVISCDYIYDALLLWDDGSMGRAGKALREVLTQYGISQNSLAVKMGLQRSAIYKWFHEERDPTAETVVDITEALKSLNSQAAEDFVKLYLGDVLSDS